MSHEVVTVIATFKVKAGLEARARAALLAAVPATREEAGCLDYDLHQSATDPTEFLFYENWESDAALKAHAASTAEHRMELRRQLGDLVDGPPKLTVWRRVSAS